jgi:acetyl-CoA carboxylase carboxyl transferase subunit beta
MNWLTNFVRPRIHAWVKRDVPENLWRRCTSCDAMIHHRQLEENLEVCPHCGHHMRINAEKRLRLLFDEGQYDLVDLPDTPFDPLKFRDLKRYADRLKADQAKVGRKDAIIVARGRIRGIYTVVAAFDFAFMGGSMGVAVGEAIVVAARLAAMQHCPLVVIPASGGARMQEGILSLMQMPRTVIAVEMVKEKGLPYIVVLTDPTTGGVTASFAMLGDIQIAETGAMIGFAGSRVIEETIRQSLPEGFQRAEYLRDHGMVDIVATRKELPDVLGKLLNLLMHRNPPAEVVQLPTTEAKPVPAETTGEAAPEPQAD